MNQTHFGDIHFHDGELGISQCVWCRHRATDGRHCRAFPGGIPEAIIKNRHDHREPYDGDQGIRFEPESVEIEFVEVEPEEDSEVFGAPPEAEAEPEAEPESMGAAADVFAVELPELQLDDVSCELDEAASG